jgi:dihydroorotate dehydrogenase
MNPADARRRLDLGAALIQLYTGLIYGGPGLVKRILKP